MLGWLRRLFVATVCAAVVAASFGGSAAGADDRDVGDGKPGPITRRAQELYMGTVKGESGLHTEWLEYV